MDKLELQGQWHSLKQQVGEEPRRYLTGTAIHRQKLEAYGWVQSDHDANVHYVRNLLPDFHVQRSVLLAHSEVRMELLEKVILTAWAETEAARKRASESVGAYALVTGGDNRGGGGGNMGDRGKTRGQRRTAARQQQQQPQQPQQQHQPYFKQQQQRGWGGPSGGQGASYGRRHGPLHGGRGFSGGGRHQQQPVGGRFGGRGAASGGRGRGPFHQGPPGSDLPAYPVPQRGYDYSAYPPHMYRPQENELPIHPNDPREGEEGGRALPIGHARGAAARSLASRSEWADDGPLGESFFMIMFGDSFRQWMKLYGMRRKSDTLAFVKKFLADVSGTGVPRSFRMDNGGEFISRDFIAFCDNAGIRRTYTAPGTPQQNGPAESAIWRVNKAGHAARLEARRLFPKIDFTRVHGFGRDGERLWLESCHWAAGGFNRSPTKANVGYKLPHELFTGRPPPLQIVPFLQPKYMRVTRARKMDPQAVLCCYLNNGDNHPESAVKVLKFATGRVCMANNVMWVSDRAPLLTPPLEMPAPADEGGDLDVPAAPFLIAPPATLTPPSPAAPSTAATPPPPVTAPPATPFAAAPPFTTTATPFATAPPFTTTAPPATPFAVAPPSPAVAPPGAAPSTNMPPLTTRTIRELDVGRGDMRVSARTRAAAKDQGGGRASSMPPLSARANRELDLGRGTRVPGRLRVRGDKATLLSTLTTRSVVDGGRKEIPSSAGGREVAEPEGRERGGPKQKDSMACEQNLSLLHFDIKQAFVQSDLDEDVFMRLPEGCGRLSGLKLSEFDQDEEVVSWPFRELIGSLMLLATQTRPDIANAVRAVAQYCASLKEIHWRAGRGILGYVVRTSDTGITFRRGSVAGLSMEVFADADYASKAADKRSVSGGLVICWGGCVSWFSRTQKCVPLSTTEAEHVSLADVMKEVLFLRQVWRLMLPEAGMPFIPVFEDNQGAIQLAKNPISNSNSEHIDVRHHFIRELVGRKEISIFHVESAYQHANFLTRHFTSEILSFIVIS
ncbi:unnamed protein product [Ectocarpus sp. CCAP 1310/34]|nr:unnamed protein product [Ectocarpus sp. CCAP 1310/34]